MIRTSLFMLIVATCCLMLISCTDEDKIGAAIQDGSELQNGAQVAFLLGQNFPNPFNTSTIIYFTVEEKSHLRLRILTEDFQEVTTLIDADYDPGNHMVTYAVDQQTPSGEYYYTLDDGSVTQIRKMKLVK
jgi:hypothetical protein